VSRLWSMVGGVDDNIVQIVHIQTKQEHVIIGNS
jgi:hypothetical protein